MMTENDTWLIHPGEILKEEFLKPLNLSVWKLAQYTHVPPIRLNDIVRERRGITVDTALRLAKFFGTTPQFWLTMQVNFDIKKAQLLENSSINSIIHYQDCPQPNPMH